MALIAALILFVATSAGAEGITPIAAPCSEFRQFANLVSQNQPYVPFATLERELPWMPNPEKLKAEMPERIREWLKLHPGDYVNVPMPENKPGVDWAKKILSEVETDKYYGYRDGFTRLLTTPGRRATIAKLRSELADIETRGYPQHDTVVAVSRVLEFLGKIDRRPPDIRNFVKHLEAKLGKRINFPPDGHRKVDNLYRKVMDAVGPERKPEIENYLKEVATTVENLVPAARRPGLNVMHELRRFYHEYGFQISEHHALVGFQFNMNPEQFRPLLLVPGTISNRALAELTLFETDVGGLAKYYQVIDRGVGSPLRFLSHDTNHTSITRRSKIAQTLLGRTSAEKHKLLATIDSISDSRQRELANGGLLMALREGVDVLFTDSADTVGGLREMWLAFDENGISVDEAKWLLGWWRQYLPTGR